MTKVDLSRSEIDGFHPGGRESGGGECDKSFSLDICIGCQRCGDAFPALPSKTKQKGEKKGLT